jgi:hypothetical protein
MKGKIFSPDEANRMLPLVSRIADDIVATYAKVHHALREFELEKARLQDASLQGLGPVDVNQTGSESAQRLEALDRDVARLLDRFQGLIEEIEALGGTVKDYERGCIDFYGEVDGEIVYLCWQRGEDALTHWHRLDEGFASRHRIPVVHAA